MIKRLPRVRLIYILIISLLAICSISAIYYFTGKWLDPSSIAYAGMQPCNCGFTDCPVATCGGGCTEVNCNCGGDGCSGVCEKKCSSASNKQQCGGAQGCSSHAKCCSGTVYNTGNCNFCPRRTSSSCARENCTTGTSCCNGPGPIKTCTSEDNPNCLVHCNNQSTVCGNAYLCATSGCSSSECTMNTDCNKYCKHTTKPCSGKGCPNDCLGWQCLVCDSNCAERCENETFTCSLNCPEGKCCVGVGGSCSCCKDCTNPNEPYTCDCEDCDHSWGCEGSGGQDCPYQRYQCGTVLPTYGCGNHKSIYGCSGCCAADDSGCEPGCLAHEC